MKMTKAALLAAIEERQKEYDLAVLQWDIAVDAVEHAAQRKYKADTDELWRQYRNKITAALKRNMWITTEVVGSPPERFKFSRGHWEATKFGSGRIGYRWTGGFSHGEGPRPSPLDVVDLPGIRKLLGSVEDTVFTTANLTAIGINAPVLRRLFGIETDTERSDRLKRAYRYLR